MKSFQFLFLLLPIFNLGAINSAKALTLHEVADTNDNLEAVIVSTHIFDSCTYYVVEVRDNGKVVAKGTVSSCGKNFRNNTKPHNGYGSTSGCKEVKRLEKVNTIEIEPVKLEKLDVPSAEKQYELYLQYKKFKEKVELSLSPNPTDKNLKIEVMNGQIEKVEIIGINGLSKTFIDNYDQIDVSDFPVGNYVVKVILEDGRTATEVFVKK